MDFDLNEDQRAILEAVDRLLEQHAGPTRTIELNTQGAYDDTLHAQLLDSGFSNVAQDFATEKGPAGLEAALVVEAIARAGGVVAAGAQLLVAPLVDTSGIEGPIALCTMADIADALPVRFAAHARTLLVLDEKTAFLYALSDKDMEPVRSSFGYPMGRAANGAALAASVTSGEALTQAQARALANWWRLSLAVEAVGTMDAALHHTVEYLKQRRQFGRTIGSFQAVQHRLSHCAIQLEASRWLAREAAYHGAGTESVAAAAAYALDSADLVFTETHQLSGAIGFTREFDLHVWSMRLLGLRQELDGVAGARRDLVASRWSASA